MLESAPVTGGQKLILTKNIVRALIFHINIFQLIFITVFKDRPLLITLLFIDENTKLLKFDKTNIGF